MPSRLSHASGCRKRIRLQGATPSRRKLARRRHVPCMCLACAPRPQLRVSRLSLLEAGVTCVTWVTGVTGVTCVTCVTWRSPLLCSTRGSARRLCMRCPCVHVDRLVPRRLVRISESAPCLIPLPPAAGAQVISDMKLKYMEQPEGLTTQPQARRTLCALTICARAICARTICARTICARTICGHRICGHRIGAGACGAAGALYCIRRALVWSVALRGWVL